MSMSVAAVGQALDEAARAASRGDEDRRWELVTQLHDHGGPQALTVASQLCAHAEPLYRALAADVLGQLGGGPGRPAIDGPFRDAALALLLTMAEDEHDPVVLSAIAIGFGHIGDERCVEPLARLHTHPDADVRSAVAFGLVGRREPAALDTLIRLSADGQAEVRDWATFGLARGTDEDFPGLRDALADRLADDDPDTRAEAIHGLAVRGDRRAVPPLLDALEAPARLSDPFVLTEALHALAAASTDPRLHRHLAAASGT